MYNKPKRTLSVTANKSAKTFTLRFTYNDGSKVKYRTLPMSREEFEQAEYWTEGDWIEFLKTDEYYSVK